MACGGGGIAASMKARVRKASLFQPADYEEFLDLNSVADIAVRLGKTSYSEVLSGFSLDTMHRAELEFLLEATMMVEGIAFRHYMGPDYARLLDLWLENFDIELFKGAFRINMGTGNWENDDIQKLLQMVSDFHLTLVDQDRLFGGRTLRDILSAVKNDSLKKALAEAVPAGSDTTEMGMEDAGFQKTVFAMGMILDRYYFDNLYSVASSMGGSEGTLTRLLIGTRVDLMNLYWIYRGRRFFGMAPEEALTLIMKARYRADFGLLSKAAFADVDSFADVLKDGVYAGVFDVEEKDAALREVAIESHIYKMLFRTALRIFAAGSQGFHKVVAYLMLKEIEIRDLVAVIEAVRYGFDRSRVDMILIRPLEKVGGR